MPATRASGSTRKLVLVSLVAIAICLVLMPTRWTSNLMGLVQVIIPFQTAVQVGLDSLDSSLPPASELLTPENYDRLHRQKESLEHRAATYALRISELEDELKILSATRLWDVDGQRIGTEGKLIPARVLTKDMIAWRDSRLINAGSLQGILPGAAVASRWFHIDRGQSEGLVDGMAILLGEVLVGIVETASTHTARAKLLSDISVETKVRIGRFEGEGFFAIEQFFWMIGRGQGVMEIPDVDRRLVDGGTISEGDIVLADSIAIGLPAPMTVGRIESIQPDRKNPLLSILTVRGAIDMASLRQVYVFVPDNAFNEGSAGS